MMEILRRTKKTSSTSATTSIIKGPSAFPPPRPLPKEDDIARWMTGEEVPVVGALFATLVVALSPFAANEKDQRSQNP